MIIVLETKSKHNKDFFKNSSFSLAGITGREIRKEREINMFKSVMSISDETLHFGSRHRYIRNFFLIYTCYTCSVAKLYSEFIRTLKI